jgi:hypothetical protein
MMGRKISRCPLMFVGDQELQAAATQKASARDKNVKSLKWFGFSVYDVSTIQLDMQ